ncbi:serine/threonine protein phosphatase 1 [Lewinella aquimaris]|uniref:Serine/threonine protein phosphatase 1 n=1 Tax=Neolewinella aquimaris TaxID=1835722 RepID=A0A840EH23_9BACT|nr:metallophosphoesterase [Neolewinella aquimaris]MBB4080206.1 serine/threonine protein phosphatase 1 [Neolewinella aquimaris]
MNFVIGDIHGEVTKLYHLLEFLQREDTIPRFIFIGDYVDKGEDSKAVLELVDRIARDQPAHTFLRGNHEYMWERALTGNAEARDYLRKYGGLTTAEDFGMKSISTAAKSVRAAGENLFRRLVNYAIVEGCFISHAGIDGTYANRTLEEIPEEAFLFNRYPFIQSTRRYFGCKQSVFGHTGFYSPYRDEYKIGIDTAAAYLRRQPLTAYCTTNDRFYTSTGTVYALPTDEITSCPVIPRVSPYRLIHQ